MIILISQRRCLTFCFLNLYLYQDPYFVVPNSVPFEVFGKCGYCINCGILLDPLCQNRDPHEEPLNHPFETTLRMPISKPPLHPHSGNKNLFPSQLDKLHFNIADHSAVTLYQG